ncbi:MAG: NF038129 family PEP-CTERM protein [Steroidobacterales bacterium]
MKNDYRSTRAFRFGALTAAIASCLVIVVQSTARADSIYDVSINTASLVGTGSTLTFDFISGGGTQLNSATISDFATNGTLVSGGVNSGSVSGALPGTVTLTNAAFFNEIQQGITLGSTISFQVDLTTSAPSSGSLPDTLSFFLLDSTATTSLIPTTDPTGADSLVTAQVDGSPTGILDIFSGSSPSGGVTVTAGGGSTAAPEIDASTAMSALTLLLGGLAVLRGRRNCQAPLTLIGE